MAARSTNTMVEALQRMLHDIADAKTLADADIPFLVQIETAIIDKLREPIKQMEQQGFVPAQGAPTAPGGGGMMPPGGGGMQGGGLMQAPAAPNADELRRLLGAGG